MKEPTKWQLKNVGALFRRGGTEKKPVVDERDGTQAGYHVEHWDGRQDAVVQADHIEVDFGVHEPEGE